MKLILGSGSKSRQDILKEMGYDFEILTADIDEKAIRDEDPKKMVILIANAKADAILSKLDQPALLITADQVVTHKDEVREKPENKEEARQFLESYRYSDCSTVGSIVVTNTETGKRASGVDVSTVYFDEIPDEAINKLIEEGNVMYLAGAFSVEDPLLSPYVKKVTGSIDAIMGLDKSLTKRLIKEVS